VQEKSFEGIDAQHEELAKLARNKQYRDVLIPFAHIDPRREDSLERLSQLVDNQNFQGVKIYPPLGYGPDHPRLMDEIYPFNGLQGYPADGSLFTRNCE